MPLLFNGKELPQAAIEQIVKDYLPRTKGKVVTFQRLNARPFQVATTKGKMLNKAGSEKNIITYCTVVIPPHVKDTDGQPYGEGVLQYYRTKQNLPVRGGGFAPEYSPKYVSFVRHVMQVNTLTQKDLFAYMLLHNQNELSKSWSMAKPAFKLIRPTEDNKAKVGKQNLKVEAYNLLANLKEKEPRKLQQVYAGAGFTDWDSYIEPNFKAGDWESVLAPLYALVEADAQRVLDLIKDAALDLVAKVAMAIEKEVIVFRAPHFAWTKRVKPTVKDEKDLNIVKVPAGSHDPEEAQAWFVSWMKGSGSEVVEELNRELDNERLRTPSS